MDRRFHRRLSRSTWTSVVLGREQLPKNSRAQQPARRFKLLTGTMRPDCKTSTVSAWKLGGKLKIPIENRINHWRNSYTRQNRATLIYVVFSYPRVKGRETVRMTTESNGCNGRWIVHQNMSSRIWKIRFPINPSTRVHSGNSFCIWTTVVATRRPRGAREKSVWQASRGDGKSLEGGNGSFNLDYFNRDWRIITAWKWDYQIDGNYALSANVRLMYVLEEPFFLVRRDYKGCPKLSVAKICKNQK